MACGDELVDLLGEALVPSRPGVPPVHALLHPLHEPHLSRLDIASIQFVSHERVWEGELARRQVSDHERNGGECDDDCGVHEDHECEWEEYLGERVVRSDKG